MAYEVNVWPSAVFKFKRLYNTVSKLKVYKILKLNNVYTYIIQIEMCHTVIAHKITFALLAQDEF